jgi:hypothetical protein
MQRHCAFCAQMFRFAAVSFDLINSAEDIKEAKLFPMLTKKILKTFAIAIGSVISLFPSRLLIILWLTLGLECIICLMPFHTLFVS